MHSILRFEKLKTVGAISASSGHMMRSIPTANAAADRTRLNRILLGSKDPSADVAKRLAGASVRKNSVLAIEVLITASPAWFSAATRDEKTEWMDRSRKWLTAHFGQENVVHLQLHMDEETPHLTGFIVPLDTTGRLNAAKWLDGSKKLAAMQTDYSKTVAHLGLERGIEGSRAEHVPPTKMRGMANEYDVTDPVVAEELARRTVFAEKRLEETQQTLIDLREAAAIARDVPLQSVVETLGLSHDKRDRGIWVDDEGVNKISLDGQKWFDHRQAVGGGGAIDLVKHVLRVGFRDAVAWLGFEIGRKPAERAVAAHAAAGASREVASAMRDAQPFQPPAKVPSTFQRVRRYLQGRGISAATLGKLDIEGRLLSDERGNAVFLALDGAGRPRGAEIRGTGEKPFHGHATGSSRVLPWSFDGLGKNVRRLVLCESAIDAMSFYELDRDENTRFISTGGARPTCPEAVLPGISAGKWDEVVIAYDNDQVGEKFGDALEAELSAAGAHVSRRRPVGKDWNDDLKALKGIISFSKEQSLAPSSVRKTEPSPTAADVESSSRLLRL